LRMYSQLAFQCVCMYELVSVKELLKLCTVNKHLLENAKIRLLHLQQQFLSGTLKIPLCYQRHSRHELICKTAVRKRFLLTEDDLECLQRWNVRDEYPKSGESVFFKLQDALSICYLKYGTTDARQLAYRNRESKSASRRRTYFQTCAEVLGMSAWQSEMIQGTSLVQCYIKSGRIYRSKLYWTVKKYWNKFAEYDRHVQLLRKIYQLTEHNCETEAIREFVLYDDVVALITSFARRQAL
jgi:hypothetical protein